MIIIDCNNKKFEMCLKEYRKRSDKAGTISELVKRKKHTKPSEKRRAEILAAKYRNLKAKNDEL